MHAALQEFLHGVVLCESMTKGISGLGSRLQLIDTVMWLDAAARPKADRQAAAKKAVETKKRKAAEAGAASKKKAAAK